MLHDIINLPEWSRAWAQKRLAEHVAAGGEVSPAEWTHLRDWLLVLPTERPKMPAKMGKVTLAQAMKMQHNWHADMAARSARIASKRGKFVGDPDAVETVCPAVGLAEGWRWVRILTPEGLDYEGNAMGHCVGRGSYDRGPTIFSLRDPNGLPHCTVEWSERQCSVLQVQGRANAQVVERYHAAVCAFVNRLRPREVCGAAQFGHILINGTLMSILGLPENLHVHGHLTLQDCVLTHLPRGLVVEGHLSLFWAPALTHLPEGLHVGGNLTLRDCPLLTRLPTDMRVEGGINVCDCPAFAEIPDELCVDGGMIIRDCQVLTVLPNDLHIKGPLLVLGCPNLTRVGEGIQVDGDAHFLNCASLTHVLEGMRVGGNLAFSGCGALVSLSDGLDVGLGLRLNACPSLHHLPDGLRVGGRLNVVSCGLKEWPMGLRVHEDVHVVNCPGLNPLPGAKRAGKGWIAPVTRTLDRINSVQASQ